MNIEEIEKALKEAGVDAGVITAVKGLDNSAEVERLTGELKAEQGKSAKFLTDKKELKEKLAEAEKEREEIKNSSLTGDEKRQKEIEEARKAVEELKKQIEDKDKAVAAEKREAEILKLASGLKGADGVAASTLNTLVKTQLADVEDLSDSDAVTAKINDLMENNKGLFAADTTAGTGETHRSGDGGGADKESSIADNQKAIWGTK